MVLGTENVMEPKSGLASENLWPRLALPNPPEREQETLAFFCNHLVSLGGSYVALRPQWT